MNPDNVDMYFNMGNAYYCTKDFEKAKEVYANMIAKNPQEYRCWFNLAEVHAALGNKEEALRCFVQSKPLAEQGAPNVVQRLAEVFGSDAVPVAQKTA
jgi:tetratricopeptide (TPR) repeat protein